MSLLVTDCPRCDAKKITFDSLSAIPTTVSIGRYPRQDYEVFCVCRECNTSTVFVFSYKEGPHYKNAVPPVTALVQSEGSIPKVFKEEAYICLKNMTTVKPPKHILKNVEDAFKEGATCLAVDCFNAAATMFRLCVDLTTKGMLPEKKPDTLSTKQFKALSYSLGYRLEWLFDNGRLPEELSELSTCIKDDGNDGAHQGILKKEDAEDTLDFTIALLNRLCTEPEQLRIAKNRKKDRRKEGK